MSAQIQDAFNAGQMIVKIGFSGTRKGMSQTQKDLLFGILKDKNGMFHHGDCVGADAEAHDIATTLGYKVYIHPPLDESLRAFKTGAVQYPKMPYKVRNKNIVEQTALLIACPLEFNGKGGTWNAIQWAKHFKRMFFIILPNGEIYHDDNPQIDNTLKGQIRQKGIILPN